jgi:hypothetical protein
MDIELFKKGDNMFNYGDMLNNGNIYNNGNNIEN